MKVFVVKNTAFCENAIMKGCDLREGLFASLVFCDNGE
jgi:hypothetical protein